MNAQRLDDMFYPSLNEQTGEVRCVQNPLEYHKLQYLKMSDSAHFWIPLWQSKKWKELQNQKRSERRNPFSYWLLQKLPKNSKLRVWDKNLLIKVFLHWNLIFQFNQFDILIFLRYEPSWFDLSKWTAK